MAGRNTRYNNIQIDGAVNNDLFGLADSGTPGGQADAQPISIDAIQELQLLVAPYDVRQGGFSGGGVNAVTRSGTNEFHGTGVLLLPQRGLRGRRPERPAIATFDDKQFGASLGGPIVKDKAFFFVNVEFSGARSRPASRSTARGQAFGRQAEVARFLSILQTRYSYDPGGPPRSSSATRPNDKVLAASTSTSAAAPAHAPPQLHQGRQRLRLPDSTTRFIFPDYFYQFNDKTNSTVAQLNSTFGSAGSTSCGSPTR